MLCEVPPLDDALELAWKKLRGMIPKEIASRVDVHYDSESNSFLVPFLGENYLVSVRSGEVLKPDGSPANNFFATIILHYLVDAKGGEISGEYLSFRQLYGGDVYFGAFERRAIRPLRETFGEEPSALIRAAEPLGGKAVELGDSAVQIQVFPKLPLTVVIWAGDEEVPPSANILFDSSANRFLPTEDLAAIGEIIAKMLVQRKARGL